MLEYRYLKAFFSVARLKSFKLASQEMGISISAVSRQVTLLEQGFGGELLIRNNKRLIVTPLGIRLANQIEAFESQMNHLKDEGVLRIGCLESVFEFFLVKVIAKNPKVFRGRVSVHIGTPEDLHERAEAGELDLILTNQDPVGSAILSGTKLFQESLEVVGHGKRPVVFSAFKDYYSNDLIQSKERVEVNTFGAAMALVQNRVGKSLVAKPVHANSRSAHKAAQWIYVVTPNYQTLPPRLRDTLAAIKRH